MSDHILEQLGAYLDGELHGGQLHKVEAHLADCESCRMELASLKSLSEMLRDAPAADFPSVERFAANVNLRLARRPETPLQRKALELGWSLVPVGLLLAWIFVHTTNFVSNGVAVANQAGLLDGGAAWLASTASQADWSATLGQFGLLRGNGLQMAEVTEAFSRTAIPGIAWQVAIALLYLCWIAIGWARQTRGERGQLLDNGSRPTVE